jgi:hypothetical protein
VIDAYGTGAQPVINGGNAEEALKLFNQQYWEINNLEVTGGTRYGVYVSGNTPNASINHIYVKNLNVHGATYTSTKRADSGEVFISTGAAGETLNDVLVDGVTAHDSHVSEGIFVSAGGAWTTSMGRSTERTSAVISSLVSRAIMHMPYMMPYSSAIDRLTWLKPLVILKASGQAHFARFVDSKENR